MVGIVSRIKGALGVKEPALEKANKTIAERKKREAAAAKKAKPKTQAKPSKPADEGKRLLGGMAGKAAKAITDRNKKQKKVLDSL